MLVHLRFVSEDALAANNFAQRCKSEAITAFQGDTYGNHSKDFRVAKIKRIHFKFTEFE